MMRVVVVLCLLCAACGDKHALTYTKASDPIWQLNPTLWSSTSNQITEAPTLQGGQQP